MKSPFDSLFGRSPIRPMQQHMAKAHSCVSLLTDFYAATIAGDWQAAEKLQQQIATLEREADDLKRDIRLNLPNSLMLPVPRSDILELLTTQDMLANHTKDIAGLMFGRQMQTPEILIPAMREYVQASVQASEHALKAINELDELVETGFRGKEVEFVEGLIRELDQIEHANDDLQIRLRRKMLGLEKSLPPVDVMFFYEIIDRIGELADYAQKVGHRLMLLIAR